MNRVYSYGVIILCILMTTDELSPMLGDAVLGHRIVCNHPRGNVCKV